MKRQRSPDIAPFVPDYRPYASGVLEQRLALSRTRPQRDQWDCYYRNNTVNGYKDRHYLLREFAELRDAVEGNETFSWMEAGCGVGNAFLPVLEAYGDRPQWKTMYAFDISAVAVELLRGKVAALPQPVSDKVRLAALDPTSEDIRSSSALFGEAEMAGSVTVASMIFVLCSIAVEHHKIVLERVAACMKRPGGVFFFRDYAADDHAQHRFSSRRRTDSSVEATFERTNGTLTHFFTLEEAKNLFCSAGFEVIDLTIVDRDVVNRKTRESLKRCFIQGRFRLA
eukprot:gene5374-3869_t